jgi:hypothetical protein
MQNITWFSQPMSLEEVNRIDLEQTLPATPFARRAAAWRDGTVLVVDAYDPWKKLDMVRQDLRQRRARRITAHRVLAALASVLLLAAVVFAIVQP